MKTRPCLTSDDAQRIMTACKAEAEKHGWRATIVIVDEFGALMLAERLEGAAPISAEVALSKAKTSALTRRPTKFWEDRAKDRPGFLKFPADSMLQGGIPLTYRGECVGAVGVSGVQSKEDEQIALAGQSALEQ
ncbi:GlcG/HbpS family heme-binding protein [Rhodoplanes sp. Z2-YC6860]|uniref:GlcG/HbpS family heme-binding protein n=1 Tax=Rhodoplanes sp. Z2-YC6860 TaxID=674703 RepID=UPI00078BF111|nr:heme-binding protein [Rhodoplanes sp. Z2-YC6860]AMN39916.1 GlcG protein [Rhodoplanes sp. Z2-YC6860]